MCVCVFIHTNFIQNVYVIKRNKKANDNRPFKNKNKTITDI